MEQKMYAYKCTSCGELHHPRHYVCRKCGARDFEEVPLTGEAELLTYTVVYNLPEGYMVPYLVFGIVRFENGLTVSGQIAVKDVHAGMKLAAETGVVREGVGVDYYGFIFKPVS
jgi:uncharacterized OB-fold protein